MFSVCNGWSYTDSFFFCFTALGTIGITENPAAGDDSAQVAGSIFVLVRKFNSLIFSFTLVNH